MTRISVIIPTQNRAETLESTLVSIERQDYSKEDFEVLIVDNGSRDRTAEVARQFCERLPNFKYFHESTPGLHAGRHRGLNESSGSILVYADDDIKAEPGWLTGIHESFADPQVGMVGGKNIPDYESPPPPWLDQLWQVTEHGRYLTYFSLLDFGDNIREIHPYFVFGCNFSIRKDLLQKIKGFHPDGMPPDKLKYRGDGESHVAMHVLKLGYKTIYQPKASVRHLVSSERMNFEYVLKRAFSEGISRSYQDTRKRYLEGYRPSLTDSIKKLIEKARNLLDRGPQSEIRKSFEKGYSYHQHQLKEDKQLLIWVLKENYL